jgi:hypothetical protein
MKHLTTCILGNAMLLLLLLSCKTVDPAQKYPNMVANVDPFSVGAIEVQFDRIFSSKVDKVQVEAVFHPRLNVVSLDFKYEYLSYKQFWDEAARKQFADSLELYKRDFEGGKLANNYRKTRDAYGRVKGRVQWVAFKHTVIHVSNPTIEIGYRFKGKTPFFTTLMRSAKEVLEDKASANSMTSALINMYFTRAQADELAGYFDQARLIEILGEKGIKTTDKSVAETALEEEYYREYEER